MLDGTSTLWHSGCSEGKTSEAEESTVTDPEQTVELKSHQPTTGGHSVSLKHQEQEETISEEPVKQREDGDGDAVCLNNNPFATDYTETSQNKATEKKNNGSETDTLQVCVTEKTDEMMDDRDEGGAVSVDSVGLSCGCVKTADTPSESEKKANVSLEEQGPNPNQINVFLCKTQLFLILTIENNWLNILTVAYIRVKMMIWC